MRMGQRVWIQAAVGAFLVFGPALGLVACAPDEPQEMVDSRLADELVGTWFAYRDNAIENMWTFRRDGTVSNDGWPNAPTDDDRVVPPYHIEGTYRVMADRVEVYIDIDEEVRDTLFLRDPKVSHNRLVYTAANFPVVFLRERAAVGQGYVADSENAAPGGMLSASDIVGDWVAFAGGFPANAWSFNDDGTFQNEGWEPLDPSTILVRRLYQVSGTYEVSGRRVILNNDEVRRFNPQTNEVADTQPLSGEEIVLYNVVADDGHLIYTNDSGLPVVYRRGNVTPTNW